MRDHHHHHQLRQSEVCTIDPTFSVFFCFCAFSRSFVLLLFRRKWFSKPFWRRSSFSWPSNVRKARRKFWNNFWTLFKRGKLISKFFNFDKNSSLFRFSEGWPSLLILKVRWGWKSFLSFLTYLYDDDDRHLLSGCKLNHPNKINSFRKV